MTNKAPFAVPLYWRLAFHAGLVVLSLAVLVPLAVVLGAAFKPSSEMFSMRPWPLEPTFDNFRAVLFETPFATYAWNSIATTVLRVGGNSSLRCWQPMPSRGGNFRVGICSLHWCSVRC